MSVFLSMILFSISHVGFGNSFLVLMGDISDFLSIFPDFDSEGFFHWYHDVFPVWEAISFFSTGVSHFLVIFFGSLDFFHPASSHLYPVLLFLNPVPGFTEFLSQLDFLSRDISHSFFWNEFQNGFLEFSVYVSVFDVFWIYSLSLFFEKLLWDFFVSFLHWSLDSPDFSPWIFLVPIVSVFLSRESSQCFAFVVFSRGFSFFMSGAGLVFGDFVFVFLLPVFIFPL